MDIYILILICTLGVAAIGGIGALLWQLVLSRDKRLNQKAHLKALEKESEALNHLREQQESSQRFQAHHEILDKNKESIEALDKKIDALFERKISMIKSYGEMVQQESASMIQNFNLFASTKMPSALCDNFHKTFEAYETELATLQEQRANLWTTQTDFQKHLIEEERIRNEKLDDLYYRHTALLEKIYLSQAKNIEEIDKASIEAGTESLKYSIFYPFQFLTSFFGAQEKPNLLKKTMSEMLLREKIRAVENEINQEQTFDYEQANLLPARF
ncbi:MAG: hypothetical protein P1U61_08135 [Legionellaceae bacterium]|nr:hypothetical protein [Legionellaceae bacterium]